MERFQAISVIEEKHVDAGMGKAGLAQLCVAHQYKDSMRDRSQIKQVLRNPLNPCGCLVFSMWE